MEISPLQVGITGGMGAGKSLVCKIFEILGVPIYDADSQAKYLMSHDKQLRTHIMDVFGSESYHDDFRLNRSFLAALVFRNPEKVATLNQLVHPAVAKDYQQWAQHQSPNSTYLIKEAALMIESGSHRALDYLIAVVAPLELRISRVLSRDPQRNRQQILDIISNQLSDKQRIAEAHFVIHNDLKQMLIPQVLQLHKKFTDLRGS